jgi:hypothetical protein
MDRQEILDRFYFRNGRCCAGCDWWKSLSSQAGECTRSAPAAGKKDRWAMLGITGCSLKAPAGHVLTPRDHVCGEFKDEFDWTTLPLPYRKRVGAPV